MPSPGNRFSTSQESKSLITKLAPGKRRMTVLRRRAARPATVVGHLRLVNTARADEAGSTAAASKALALEFYQRLFGDKDIGAIDQYLTEGCIQHNPCVPTGREALKQAFGGLFVNAQKTKADMRRVAAEGDLVWLHVRTVMPDGRPVAIVEIFPVDQGRSAEHWDVMQPEPEKAANDNGIF